MLAYFNITSFSPIAVTVSELSSGQNRIKFNPHQVCSLLDQCLKVTYFKYKEKHDSATGSQVHGGNSWEGDSHIRFDNKEAVISGVCR